MKMILSHIPCRKQTVLSFASFRFCRFKAFVVLSLCHSRFCLVSGPSFFKIRNRVGTLLQRTVCSEQSRNLFQSGIQLLKVGIPKMSANPSTAWIACSLPDLHHTWSWNVVHFFKFYIISPVVWYIQHNSCYLMGEKCNFFFLNLISFGGRHECCWRIVLNQIAWVFAGVLLLWQFCTTDWNIRSVP